MRRGTALVTTPNEEYNVPRGGAPGQLRRRGKRFEWSHAGFRLGFSGVAARRADTVSLIPGCPVRRAAVYRK
jgi:hypothetical protein